MAGFLGGGMGGRGFHQQGQESEGPPLDKIQFHPLDAEELTSGSGQLIGISISQLGLQSKHRQYSCGACGSTTNGRVVCEVKRKADDANVSWCWCSCDKGEPTIIVEKDGKMISQLPLTKDFHPHGDWPVDLAQLYEEAAKSLSAGANTACAMVCRKLLMATACHEKAKEGESFASYVDYITDTVLTFSKAKASIEKIKQIGNDANHKIVFVSPDDAKRAMQIVTYMLTAIYSLPNA